MLKNELRLTFTKLRQELSEADYQRFSEQIAARTRHLPIWDFTRYHLFLPIRSKREVDTAFLQQELRRQHKEVVVPRVVGDGQLAHYLIDSNTVYATSKWGIPEPVNGLHVDPPSLDVVFLPLLSLDSQGYRVGYGGGYYDRFLPQCREDVITVGLSFFEAVPEITDRHEADVQMHYAVTPSRVYAF